MSNGYRRRWWFNGTTFTGTPPANYNGTINIKVTASDGALTASDIFALTITPVNDAPADHASQRQAGRGQ
ncbi:hypothetical protein HZZ13_04805 [Bradyrhizobium sp. CNPSo 4010]|uniref:Uncharacterized protein n=1 Tax=Bradyrhizobium agreste TaxID=2751811 RepID=A0ABS0PJN1_9BRAD|nr:putative Ig domain-containing protein [Bradyrhizobium agreste]MBH5397112.1 hypothetical protein [Bradyrhizobium agreste]